MQLNDLTSPAWQRAFANGRWIVVTPVDVTDPDRQVWRALSETTRNGEYRVHLAAGPDGLSGSCTCRAGYYNFPCRHLAAVLLETGHARWWTKITARRDRHGWPQVYLVDANGDESLVADHHADIEWGYNGSGPSWLATLIVRATGRREGVHFLAVALKERFIAPAAWPGFTITAHELDTFLAEAEAAELRAAS